MMRPATPKFLGQCCATQLSKHEGLTPGKSMQRNWPLCKYVSFGGVDLYL